MMNITIAAEPISSITAIIKNITGTINNFNAAINTMRTVYILRIAWIG